MDLILHLLILCLIYHDQNHHIASGPVIPSNHLPIPSFLQTHVPCLSPSAEMIPHPQKVAKGGEDAYYISSSLLIVADGVGGWNNQGIDPGLYSKFLCKE